MKLSLTGAAVAVIGTLALASAAGADTYVRKGSQDITVTDKGGRLFCARASVGYEMCNGMTKQADGSWKGKKMKHPDMGSPHKSDIIVRLVRTNRELMRHCEDHFSEVA